MILEFIIFIIFALLVISQDFYIFVFYHKDWKLWNEISKLPKESFTKINSVQYSIKEYPNWVVNIYNYQTFISDKNTNKCILCSFYKRKSKQLYKKLCEY